MKILDIQHIDSDFNEFALAKMDLEQTFKTKDKTSLTDFIKELNVGKYVIIISEKYVITFNFHKSSTENYLFICGTDNEKTNENTIRLLANLFIKSKGNILEVLTEVTMQELIDKGIYEPAYPYFIINNKHWIIK